MGECMGDCIGDLYGEWMGDLMGDLIGDRTGDFIGEPSGDLSFFSFFGSLTLQQKRSPCALVSTEEEIRCIFDDN